MTAGAFSHYATQLKALDYTSYNYETSQHTPASYGVASGNFDGAGGSYGIIQFNWKSGTCQPIFQDMILTWTDDLVASITNTTDYNTFVDVVQNRTTTDQIAWGDTISNPANKHTIIEPWNTYFQTLGTKESYQNRQIMACTPYFNNADTWCSDFGLWTRRGYGLMFDISVQYGGITTAAHTDIMNFIAALPTYLTDELKELRKMRYIAWRTAQDHQGTYYASSLARKMSIANGQGIVYGGLVKTYDYDLLLEGNGFVGLPAKKKPKWSGT
jgi:hypothetical protein